jgi:phosphoribosylanthranilate isomerase
MIVKICGITTEEDARDAAEAGADAVGFNFWPGSKRYVTPERARVLAAVLPAGIWKAGVFVDASAEDAERIAAVAGLDVLQMHGASATAPKLRWWAAFPAGTPGLAEAAPEAEAILLDTPAGSERGGTGRAFDWSLAAGLARKVVLAGGLGPDNVAAAIAAVRPWGVDACSRLESAPGRKDREKVRAFVRAARGAMLG